MRYGSRCAMVGIAGLCAVLGGAPSARADDVTAWKAKRIVPVSGPVIEDGVVIVTDGKITAVGKVDVPPLARVVDCGDAWITPGYIESHTQVGLDRANEQQPVVPFVSALDALDPNSSAVEDRLREGITTMLVIPGNATQVGGQGIVVRPFGGSVEEMLVRRAAGLKISFDPPRGTPRAAQVAAIHAALRDAARAMDDAARRRDEGAATPGEAPTLDDPRREALQDLLRGRLPAVVYAGRAQDVPQAFRLLDTFKLKGVLVLGSDCWRAADLLKQRQDGAPADAVLYALDADLETVDRDPDTGREEVREVAGLLHRAGVRFALTSDEGIWPSRHPWYQASVAVRQGMPRDVALRAVTLDAARFLGLADRIGSLEPGKDANLLVLTGDPLSASTWVDRVVIEGKQVYDRSTDRKVKRLVEGERRESGLPGEEER